MRLDSFGLLVNDMATMIRFYRDILGFEIREPEDTSNVYLVKDGTVGSENLLYCRSGRKSDRNRFMEQAVCGKRPVIWYIWYIGDSP